MGRVRTWHKEILFSVIILLAICMLSLGVTAQGTKAKATSVDRPGDERYAPTKLEWAAVELQANFGRNWSNDDHVAVDYMPDADGKTIRCILQYTPDVSAQDLKMSQEIARTIFDKYAAHRGWTWLQVAFDERGLPAPHPLVSGNE